MEDIPYGLKLADILNAIPAPDERMSVLTQLKAKNTKKQQRSDDAELN